MNDDARAIFAAIDTLVLERTTGRNFRCLEMPPGWCAELWPACAPGGGELAPEHELPFLEVFLGEAERTWASPGPVRIDSETWTRVDENGSEIHLQATALRVGERSILLIARCDALHQARQTLLQRARELRIAHDAAGRAAEEKDVLLHCIIHELQLPLGTILGSLQELVDGAPSSSQAAPLASIALQAAQRQRELILDILQLFAAGTRAPTAGSTNMIAVIDHAVALLEPIARARGQELGWQSAGLGDAQIMVVGDASRLERVVANLLENAVRNARRSISVRVHAGGSDVSVAVEDDGPPVAPGLASRWLGKIAELRGDGSDLGLYFCRITVERWGGSLGYAPRSGGGSRLWLRLPRAPAG